MTNESPMFRSDWTDVGLRTMQGPGRPPSPHLITNSWRPGDSQLPHLFQLQLPWYSILVHYTRQPELRSVSPTDHGQFLHSVI
jgi:hypothetical protein